MHVVHMHDDTIRKDRDAAEGQIKSPTVSSHVMIRFCVPGPQAGGVGQRRLSRKWTAVRLCLGFPC